MCFQSYLRQDKPYSCQEAGLGVRDMVARQARNSRALSQVHGRKRGISTKSNRFKTGRSRVLAMSANSPCPRSIRVTNRIREQSVSAHRQRPQSSVKKQWQRS
jgi:hypothetical protein